MRNMKKILVVLAAILFLSVPYTTKAAVRVPVLLYHVVSLDPSSNNLYQYSLPEFKSEMKYLKDNGYTTISIDQYYDIISNKSSAPAKPILLTFDDCTIDFYTNVYPVLKQYNFKAVEFAVTNWIDTQGHMSSAQLRTVSANGIDIENHTTNHSNLTNMTHSQKYAAINSATAKIKSITNKTPAYCAYPYGSYDSDTISILKSLAYKGGFKVGGSSAAVSNKYSLPRTIILNGDNLNKFINKLSW